MNQKNSQRITSNVVSILLNECDLTILCCRWTSDNLLSNNKLILEGLFTLNDNLESVGVLADSYEYEADGRSIQVRLKEGNNMAGRYSFHS